MHKITHPSGLEKKVNDSHARCIEMKVDKKMASPTIISSDMLEDVIEKNSLLMSVALPYMKLAHEFLQDTGFIVDLTDANGYIISIIGDEDILERAKSMGMHLGTDMSEKSCGTNSIGTALFEKCPIQMAGTHHFIEIYHIWTCSCAPIFNTAGALIGCINVTGIYNAVHPHTLGFISTIAELIEHELSSIESKEKLWHIGQLNETIINSVDFGLLSISKSGIINSANKKACEIFACDKQRLMKRKGKELFENWNEILCTLEKDDEYFDGELMNSEHDRRRKYNINAYPIRDIHNRLTAVVFTLKDMKNIYKLINRYSGKSTFYYFNNIIGRSAQLKEIIEYARSVANTPSTVIIQGESGTGKEIFAQAIHNESNRKNEPFIAINCGAIPRNLIESELFGYENGAFTSARVGGMPGKFELAHKGTIFLDEIAEMPMDMQVNLLRVLQEKNITRIGGTRSIPVDVRVIVATNKNIIEEVKKGNFREDLYYRLHVIPIFIPPLRERKDDIRPLIEYFLESKAIKLGKETPQINARDFEVLYNYDWPGNVRELENIIENFVINERLSLHLKTEIQAFNKSVRKNEHQTITYQMQSLTDWEKIAISECLAKCNGNISKTASILNIDRSTLYKKIKLHRLLI